MENTCAPVGVFDSGVGGISVLREAVRLLPGEDYLYYGDTLHAPYGEKSAEEVRAYATEVTRALLMRGAKAIVIACNTATSAAAQALREQYDLPIIGMEPALKPASALRHGGNVLVLATPVTLRLPKFLHLMAHYGEGAVPVPCPGLMDFVERGELAGGALRAHLLALLSPYDLARTDAVVLGCTHYVFIRDEIAALFPPGTAVIDGNEGTVRQLARRLAQRGALRADGHAGRVELLTSGGPETLALMRRLLAASSNP